MRAELEYWSIHAADVQTPHFSIIMIRVGFRIRPMSCYVLVYVLLHCVITINPPTSRIDDTRTNEHATACRSNKTHFAYFWIFGVTSIGLYQLTPLGSARRTYVPHSQWTIALYTRARRWVRQLVVDCRAHLPSVYRIQKSLPSNNFKSELRCFNPFRNECRVGNFTAKLVAMEMSLERSEKKNQIYNLRSNAYHVLKMCWKSVQEILRSSHIGLNH